jgi:hypothetical protein
MSSNRLTIAAAIAATITSAASAASIQTGTYRLSNHPDGAAANPTYGMRLDELFNVTGGHDVFTFDFEAPGSAMYLDYDGTSIHIYGTAFGGRDIGSSYDPAHSSAVEIDFYYSVSHLAADPTREWRLTAKRGAGTAARRDPQPTHAPPPPATPKRL